MHNTPEEYVQAHMKVCTATKQKGISINQTKRACAKSKYKFQVKRGYPIDPLKSARP